MHEALASFALMGFTVLALAATRARGLLTHIAIEAGLVLAIGAFLFWEGTSPLPHFGMLPAGLVGAWLRALAIVWWLIGARLIVNVTVVARGRDARSREARLFSDLSAGIIYVTTIIIILNSVLDLNITGLLATSGVIAIVLGLALQNTLADVFSGIAVGLEQPFHVGDRVSLGDNVEGTIVQMNWRSIRIQTDGDDLATIPNSLVAKGQIINRSSPTRKRATSIEIFAPSDVPTGTVFELMRQAALLCPQVMTNPAPTMTIQRAGLQSSTYSTHFFVADSPAMAGAKSDLLRQTRRMLRHAGVGRNAPLTPAELLRSLVLFEALSDEEIQRITGHLVTHPVEPGDAIFRQGDASASIFIVQSGVIEISRKIPDGPAQTIGRIGPGEYVGEIGLMTGSPRAFSMKALTHGRVTELPGKCLKELLASNAGLNAAMERSVRRGQDLLDRDDAARIVEPIAQSKDLIARIKAFFGLQPGAHDEARKN